MNRLERFQEKCVAVFRPKPRQNKKMEHFCDSTKHENALERFQEKCVALVRCRYQLRPKPVARIGGAAARAGLPRALLVIVLVAGGLQLAACSPKSQAQPEKPAAGNVTLTPEQRRHIRLYTVEPMKFRKTIATTGVVDFDNDQATSVLAPFSGPVSRLFVSPGQHVRKGQPLAAVVSPDFAAAVGAYRKALVNARNLRRLADMDKDLLQHNGVSEREEAQAQADAAGAEADRDAARQALISLGVDAKLVKAVEKGRPTAPVEAIIRAPIAGTVVDKLITPGQLLQAGTTPSFTVADLSRMWVMAQLFGADQTAVNLGDTAQVDTGIDSKSFSGKVDNIAAQVDPTTRSVAVRIVVDNPRGLLKKQMYVRVLIRSGREDTGLLVPVSAVLRDDENLPFVYVVQRDGSFARRHVSLGYRTGDRYVVSGLRAGARIVIDGAIFVQFMQSQ